MLKLDDGVSSVRRIVTACLDSAVGSRVGLIIRRSWVRSPLEAELLRFCIVLLQLCVCYRAKPSFPLLVLILSLHQMETDAPPSFTHAPAVIHAFNTPVTPCSSSVVERESSTPVAALDQQSCQVSSKRERMSIVYAVPFST